MKGPTKSICNKTKFHIQKLEKAKTSGIIFRCSNYKCNIIYNIRKGSFFESFPNTRLFIVVEVSKCRLCKEMNIEKKTI